MSVGMMTKPWEETPATSCMMIKQYHDTKSCHTIRWCTIKWKNTKGCACATLDNTATPAGALFGEHTQNAANTIDRTIRTLTQIHWYNINQHQFHMTIQLNSKESLSTMASSCLGLIQGISTCCLCLFRCFMHRTHRFASPPGSLGPWMHFLRWSKPKVEPPHSIISLWISHFSLKKQPSCKLFYLLYFSLGHELQKWVKVKLNQLG